MRLLVSVTNRGEAEEAIKGGAQIIDVKNPKEGSFGASFPRIIREIREITPINIELSATIGDLPNTPGTASLAALGAAVSGAQYVKAGLYGMKTIDEASLLMKEICRAVKTNGYSCKVIAAGYADYERIGSLNPSSLPTVAKISGADGVLIDTKEKTQGTLFDYLNDEELREIVDVSHSFGLIASLAGSLEKTDLLRVFRLGTDVLGIRRALCTNKDRIYGKIQKNTVKEFVESIRLLES